MINTVCLKISQCSGSSIHDLVDQCRVSLPVGFNDGGQQPSHLQDLDHLRLRDGARRTRWGLSPSVPVRYSSRAQGRCSLQTLGQSSELRTRTASNWRAESTIDHSPMRIPICHGGVRWCHRRRTPKTLVGNTHGHPFLPQEFRVKIPPSAGVVQGSWRGWSVLHVVEEDPGVRHWKQAADESVVDGWRTVWWKRWLVDESQGLEWQVRRSYGDQRWACQCRATPCWEREGMATRQTGNPVWSLWNCGRYSNIHM